MKSTQIILFSIIIKINVKYFCGVQIIKLGIGSDSYNTGYRMDKRSPDNKNNPFN